MTASTHWLQIITRQNFITRSSSVFLDTKKTAHPGGKGPVLTAGTLGGATGLMLLVGCRVEVAAEVLAGAEGLSDSIDGLVSEAVEATEADARAGASEPN